MSNVVAMPVPRAWMSRALVGSWVAPASLMLVAAVSPFERPLPGSLAGFTLTTLELSVVAALVAGTAAALRGASAVTWRTPITIPALALLACALVASVAAPEFRANSLRFVGRLHGGAAAVHARRQHHDVAASRAPGDCDAARRGGARRRHRGAGARAGAARARRVEAVPPGLSRRGRPGARDVDVVLSNDHLDVSRGRVCARPGVDRVRAASRSWHWR